MLDNPLDGGTGRGTVYDRHQVAGEIDEARIGLRLGRADEEFLFRDVRKARLDLVVELADGLEVDLERLVALVLVLVLIHQAGLQGILGLKDAGANRIEERLLFLGEDARLRHFVADKAFDGLLGKRLETEADTKRIRRGRQGKIRALEVRRAADGGQQVRHLCQVSHLLDRYRTKEPPPASHHRGLLAGHATFADVVLERVRGEQVDAR